MVRAVGHDRGIVVDLGDITRLSHTRGWRGSDLPNRATVCLQTCLKFSGDTVILSCMMNIEVNLIEAASEWQGRIEELQALIAELEAEVVEAEVGLAEELTAVNAFEFKLRAGIRQLILEN